MASTYLSRTPSSAGNTSVWTASFWMKCSSFTNQDIFNAGTAGTNHGLIFLNGNQQLEAKHYSSSAFQYQLVTNRRFRDCNAWYHIVVTYNDLESTSSDRIKIYVNGVQETSFATANYPSLNFNSKYNETILHTIGRGIESGTSSTYRYFDGYISHFAFVDGQALAPTVFGETDSTSGIWKFKSPSGVTWGTNGFHLKFESSGNLGLDSSGEGNNFTVNGNLKQAVDTPSNVYCTLNALDIHPSDSNTFANGNTSITTNNAGARSTIAVESGKWYAEAKIPTNTSWIGVQDQSKNINSNDNSVLLYPAGASMYINGSNQGSGGYGSAWSANDIMIIALDLTSTQKKIYFGKNGGWWNGSDYTDNAPSTGVNLSNDITYAIHSKSGSGSQTTHWNFGNGFFGTTAISSAGSNGNGSLFEYDVPSGYYALNTKNINTYG